MSDSTLNPSVIQIPLTRGHIALVSVEDKDLADFKWYSGLADRNSFYAKRETLKSLGRERLFMHRVILQRILGRPLEKGEVCDHVDRNTLNNQRSNLRLATSAQNSRNQKKRADNKSGYIGVHFSKKERKWIVEVRVNGRGKRFGRFDNIHDAARLYNQVAKELHGEFAKVNEINGEGFLE